MRICCVYTFYTYSVWRTTSTRGENVYPIDLYNYDGRSKIKGVESNHIFLKSWLDISLTFTKLTIFFIRNISWATIINLITSKRLCNAVFIFAAQKLILAVGICAYFRPYRFKSQLSNRFVGQYEAKKKKKRKEREKKIPSMLKYIAPLPPPCERSQFVRFIYEYDYYILYIIWIWQNEASFTS